MKLKFAHMADCHLGSWSNHPDMRDYPVQAFEIATGKCIDEKVDFILIAGDLFDTSMPSIDVLKRTAEILGKLRDHNIPVYVVPGSHDYSPTGKTMLAVFEKAGLLTDVYKHEIKDEKIHLQFTTDKKTGVKITGVMGKRGSLEVKQFKNIDRSIENEQGFKIFMFHAGLIEERPESMKDMLALPMESLPKNFNYYASGHVHKQYFDRERMISFPGELFPTSFDELEVYGGSFIIVSVDGNVIDVVRHDARLFEIANISIDVDGKTPLKVEREIIEKINLSHVSGKVVLIKLKGILDSGKSSDIDFNVISKLCEQLGARTMKKSVSGVSSKDFKEAASRSFTSIDEIEKTLILDNKDSLSLSGFSDTVSFVSEMMNALNVVKHEDETNPTFEERVKSNAKKVVNL